nr:uncharacterized mitochondrial protein AtMg00810-like [Tanacetum cinerariifolium]
MVEKSKLDVDPQRKKVNPIRYHGMIGSIMYLTANRPDLVFVVCMCTCFVDADHVGFQDTIRSTSGSMQLLESLLAISLKNLCLDNLDILKEDLEYQSLRKTYFASGQQRIRLYCRGKKNGVNILKSIDEGPFQIGRFRETLAEGEEGALHLGPERA